MLTIFSMLLLAPLAGLNASDAPSPVSKPNVLFLIADDLGYADIGANGCTDFATPNIDSIADSGVRFTNGYVCAPVCSPSRAGLITGRWQTRFGHEFNHPLADRSPVGLPLTEKTAAQLFHDAGYVIGHVGKWHLGNPKILEFSPKARGFDESVWFPGQRKLPPLQFFRHGEQGKTDDPYVDEAMAREASAFVEKHCAGPWFLYVAFLTPHQPLDTPPGSEEPFAKIAATERRKCAAMLSLLDGSVGRILQSLRETGQAERTLVVFLSDNGAPPKNGSRNTPLRGNKGTTWEGGIRVPFVMQWKGTLPAGRVVDAPVVSLDLLPTALAAAGVKSSTRLDGVSLLPFLTGKTAEPPHAALFWRYGEQMAVRAGDWKLTRAPDQTATPPALKTGLFNLREDVSEQNDLSGNEPAKAKELQTLWDQWNAHNVKALWGGEASGGEDRKADAPSAKKEEADAPAKAPPKRWDAEPFLPRFSAAKAAEFLDAGARADEGNKCLNCHASFAYLMARPALPIQTARHAEVRSAVEKWVGYLEGLSLGVESDSRRRAEAVMAGAVLAGHDAATTGTLQPVSRRALDLMWRVRLPDGGYDWLKPNNEPPSAIDDHFGATMAAIGAGVAPEGYAETPAAQAGLERLRDWLRTHPPQHMHQRGMLLLADHWVGGLMDEAGASRRLPTCSRSSGPTAAGRWRHWAMALGDGRTRRRRISPRAMVTGRDSASMCCDWPAKSPPMTRGFGRPSRGYWSTSGKAGIGMPARQKATTGSAPTSARPTRCWR